MHLTAVARTHPFLFVMASSNGTVIDPSDLWDLVNELYDQRTKWKRIGLGLSVPKSDLDAMTGDLFDCLENMLSTWLKGINPPPTAERLVDVLQSKVVGEKKKAKEIEERFCTKHASDTKSSATSPVIESAPSSHSKTSESLLSSSSIPISDTDSELSPVTDSPLVPERHQMVSSAFSNDSFADSIISSKARPSLLNDLERIADPKVREMSKQKDCQFRTLVLKTSQHLSQVIKTAKEFDAFKVAITLLPASLEGHHNVISPDDQSAISSATTIVRIIIVLNQYWTFVQYELLEYVVQEFAKGNDILMNEMKAYIADMNEFEKEIGIDHYTAVQMSLPRPDSVALEIHHSGSQHKLFDCRLIQRSTAEQCGLHPHTVRTHKSGPGGSIIFTLLIPYSVAGHVLAVLRGMPLAKELLSQPLEERIIHFMDEAETEMFLPLKRNVFNFDATTPFPGGLGRCGSSGSLSTFSEGYATMSIGSGETNVDEKKCRSIVSEGTRAVFILGSVALHLNESVVPLAPASPSDEDCQVLTELGLLPDQWDNLNALMALYNKTENYDVFSVQVSKPGMELSRSYLLEQIEFLLKNSTKKTAGAVLHYYGNGRRNTGDWCFRDGFITFRDIADLYMKHGRGRGLTIVSDYHSSGRWVSQCAEFLDEQGVKPCGHSAREKGILLKVIASCRTGQDSTELLYTTRAMELKEDGYVYHYHSKELSAQQQTVGADFTRVRCKKGEEEECSIAPDATWSTAGEVISHRKKIVQGKDRGRPAWHFVLLDDDAEKIKDFLDKTGRSGNIDLKEYGKVFKSGWGKDPSPEDRAWGNNYGHP